MDSKTVGANDGELLGSLLDLLVGIKVGEAVGTDVSNEEGFTEIVGAAVGVAVGETEGLDEELGDKVGEAVGDSQTRNSSHLFSASIKTPLQLSEKSILSHALSFAPNSMKITWGRIDITGPISA